VSYEQNCKRCARVLGTGEGLILIAFTVAELAELAEATLRVETRSRLLRAIALLDEDTAREIE
jgi:hypothetical protein